MKNLEHDLTRRFALIERLLFWRGQVKRSDLMTKFGMSESAAALTFRAYHKARPEILVLDRSKKAYIPSGEFEPYYYAPDIEHCELHRIEVTVGLDASRSVLLALARSVREKRSLHIEYKSIGGQASRREVFPLAIVRMAKGFLPALHAWCYKMSAPRTFQISLIRHATVGDCVNEVPRSAEMQPGCIKIGGLNLEIPRAAIYAVAGQLFGVPEFRDEEALMSIEHLAKKLDKSWRSA